MAEKEINVIVKNVTKTTAEWASTTEIPAKGVICVETTTDGDTKIKIGDGDNAFSELKYIDCKNADTVDGFHANEIASNPNLLINPDFSINQRGKSIYDTAGFTVDRWKAGGGFTIAVGNGITVAAKAELSANMAALVQEVGYDASFGAATFSLYASATHENAYMLIVALDSSGAALSQSAKVHINSGLTSVTFSAIPAGTVQLRAQVTLNSGSKPSDTLALSYAKLECSEQPTKFIPPDPALELLKCQRFYQIRSTNDITPVDLRPSMGTITDIKTVEGGYAYVAEL